MSKNVLESIKYCVDRLTAVIVVRTNPEYLKNYMTLDISMWTYGNLYITLMYCFI